MTQRRHFVLIHWPKFSHFHMARLQAAVEVLRQQSMHVIGFEVADAEATYLWGTEDIATSEVERHLIFQGRSIETIPGREVFREVFKALNNLKPDVVAVNGYSTPDALAILSWVRTHKARAILMTESKSDDARRRPVPEALKSLIVRQYQAALCGGTLHKQYLETLGMPSSRIFTGYDAVDNTYFQQRCAEVRRHPDDFRHLPGLAHTQPFFLAAMRLIPRKNALGLAASYELYRKEASARGFQPWRLVLLGDGEERDALQAMIRDRSIQGMTLAGAQTYDILPAYYGLAGAFIHPALQEQWGLVVNEAMASGLAVLVSKTCGCAVDLVTNEVNGYVFDPSNSQELADLMLCLSTHPRQTEIMGHASQRIIGAWGPRRFAESLLAAVQRPQN